MASPVFLPFGLQLFLELAEKLREQFANAYAKMELEYCGNSQGRYCAAALVDRNHAAVDAGERRQLFLRKAVLPAKQSQPVWRRFISHRLPPFMFLIFICPVNSILPKGAERKRGEKTNQTHISVDNFLWPCEW
jgi:hypothetical protein